MVSNDSMSANQLEDAYLLIGLELQAFVLVVAGSFLEQLNSLEQSGVNALKTHHGTLFIFGGDHGDGSISFFHRNHDTPSHRIRHDLDAVGVCTMTFPFSFLDVLLKTTEPDSPLKVLDRLVNVLPGTQYLPFLGGGDGEHMIGNSVSTNFVHPLKQCRGNESDIQRSSLLEVQQPVVFSTFVADNFLGDIFVVLDFVDGDLATTKVSTATTTVVAHFLFSLSGIVG